MSWQQALVKIRDHLDKALAIYVTISIIIGILLGLKNPLWVKMHISILQDLMLSSIFIMIFPMMVMLRLKGLANAFRSWKLLTIVLLMNFGWGPIMAILLGHLFVSNVLLRLGIFLAWLVPCSSMTVGYVGLMRGNIEVATAMVAITFLIGIPLIPLYAGWYGAIYHIHVSMTLLIWTVIEVILIPMILGVTIHESIVRKIGLRKFKQISPIFPSITMIGMFMIVFLIFFTHAILVITHMHQVFGVFYTALTFGTISLLFMTILLHSLKIDYWDSMATLFPSIGKNEATAIAIASTAFSPFVAIPPAVFPIFQIIFLVAYIKLRPKIAHYFGIKTRDVAFKE